MGVVRRGSVAVVPKLLALVSISPVQKKNIRLHSGLWSPFCCSWGTLLWTGLSLSLSPFFGCSMQLGLHRIAVTPQWQRGGPVILAKRAEFLGLWASLGIHRSYNGGTLGHPGPNRLAVDDRKDQERHTASIPPAMSPIQLYCVGIHNLSILALDLLIIPRGVQWWRPVIRTV
jgi:hypothetical protein